MVLVNAFTLPVCWFESFLPLQGVKALISNYPVKTNNIPLDLFVITLLLYLFATFIFYITNKQKKRFTLTFNNKNIFCTFITQSRHHVEHSWRGAIDWPVIFVVNAYWTVVFLLGFYWLRCILNKASTCKVSMKVLIWKKQKPRTWLKCQPFLHF